MANKDKKSIKVYIVGPATYYADFIKNAGVFDVTITKNKSEADLFIFTGGEDVCPALYNESCNSKTYYNCDRDTEEISEYNDIPEGKLKVGICRGSQFLTAMNGGKLIQDVTNHAINGYHAIAINGEYKDLLKAYPSLYITSTHHQMMFPFNLPKEDYEIIAHALPALSKHYAGGEDDMKLPEDFVEPEIVYYHKTNTLCIQGHPEQMASTHLTVTFLNNLIEKLLFKDAEEN